MYQRLSALLLRQPQQQQHQLSLQSLLRQLHRQHRQSLLYVLDIFFYQLCYQIGYFKFFPLNSFENKTTTDNKPSNIFF